MSSPSQNPLLGGRVLVWRCEELGKYSPQIMKKLDEIVQKKSFWVSGD